MPAAGEPLGERQADPARRSGDDGDPPGSSSMVPLLVRRPVPSRRSPYPTGGSPGAAPGSPHRAGPDGRPAAQPAVVKGSDA